jgi:transcription termination/antitermination protein NusG
MPLLPLEPFVFPDQLLDQPCDATATNGSLPWWVLHTRPRAEKALARKLLRQGTAFFLPIRKKQWQKHGRTFSSHVPLFPGYLFLKADDFAAFRTLETNFVARILRVPDQFQLQADLARVYRLIASGGALVPEEKLRPGALVEITTGPLSGLEGKILRRGKQLKFIVEVQFLQRGVSVEIESWMFEPRSSPQLVSGEW